MKGISIYLKQGFVLWWLLINQVPISVFGQGSLEIVSHTKKGGISYGINVDEEYAFVTNNNGVYVFDIKNPRNPALVSKINTGVTFGIDIQDDQAFIIGGDKLRIVNIIKPEKPIVIKELCFKEYSQSLIAEDTYLYIANERGLDIFDISDPNQIRNISHFGDTWYRTVVIKKDIAYLANYKSGVEVIDISDPTGPQRIAAVSDTERAVNLHVHNDFLFVARSNLGISILDISIKESPKFISSFCDNDDGEAKDVWGDEEYIFIQDGFGVEVIDISNPSNPFEICENRNSGGHEIFSDGDFVYVATGRKGMIVLQLQRN
jgi:hypothetical protein